MTSLAWIRRIAPHIPALNQTPLMGNAPPFPQAQFSQELASRFGVPQFAVQWDEPEWKEPEAIYRGLGKECLTIPVTVTPIGTFYWIASREDIRKLTASLMKPEGKSRPLTSDILQEGFYRYLLLEALDALQKTSPFDPLTLQISEEEGPSQRSLCIDIEIKAQGKTSWGRVAIPEATQETWISYFSKMPLHHLSSEKAQNTHATLAVHIGSVTLSEEEWSKLEPGDGLVLDQTHQGMALLKLGTIPLFKGRLEENQIKLLDDASSYEIPPSSLDLQIEVELTQLQVTLETLLHLTPGKTLELPLDLDQKLSLFLEGKKVGEGEFVLLGNVWVLRILTIHE